MPETLVFRVPTRSPQDVSGLVRLLDSGRFQADDVVAAIGKTEGNGGANDFSKDFAIDSIQAELTRRGAQPGGVYFIMSGGCEGVMSPHVTYLVRTSEPTGLGVGVARAGRQPAEQLGRLAQARTVAQLVRAAQHDAGIKDTSHVHLAQVKCPTLSAAEIRDAHSRGEKVVTDDPARSAAFSRGAAALGVALALDELTEHAAISDASVLADWDQFTSVGCVSSEIGTDCHEVMVIGQAGEGDRYRLAHGVLQDLLDAEGARQVLAEAGIQSRPGGQYQLAALLAKCEPDPRGSVRGWRHTMLTDADIGAFRHARGAAAAMLASICGDPAIYVSGGAEHQGPLGGGTLSVIAELRQA
jgi:cyanuric acid amidohydrolase